MSLYYFHIRERSTLNLDDTGVDLPDAEAAFEEAVKAALGMTNDAALRGNDISRRSFEVTDRDGNSVFTFAFALAEAEPRPSVH